MSVAHFNDIVCILPEAFHVYYQNMIGLEKESSFSISLEDIKFDEKIFIKKTNIEQYNFEHEIENCSTIKIIQYLNNELHHFGPIFLKVCFQDITLKILF